MSEVRLCLQGWAFVSRNSRLESNEEEEDSRARE